MLPNRSTLTGQTFKNACQKAADHFAMTIDGKQKEFETSTYANVKNVLKNIQKSGYFDKVDQQLKETNDIVDDGDENVLDEPADELITATINNEPSTMNANIVQATANLNIHSDNREVFNAEQPNKIEAPSASAVPVPTFATPPQQQQQQQQPPQQQQQQQQPLPPQQQQQQQQPPHNLANPGIPNAAKTLKPLPQSKTTFLEILSFFFVEIFNVFLLCFFSGFACYSSWCNSIGPSSTARPSNSWRRRATNNGTSC